MSFSNKEVLMGWLLETAIVERGSTETTMGNVNILSVEIAIFHGGVKIVALDTALGCVKDMALVNRIGEHTLFWVSFLERSRVAVPSILGEVSIEVGVSRTVPVAVIS